MSPSAAATNRTAPNKQYDPPPSVFTLRRTAQLEALYTIIRDKDTSRGDFIFYSDRIIRLLVEEGLNHLPVVPRVVETPTVRAPPERGVRTKQLLTACRGRRTKVLGLRGRSAAFPFCARERCVSSSLYPMSHCSGYGFAGDGTGPEGGLSQRAHWENPHSESEWEHLRHCALNQHVAFTDLSYFRMRKRPVPNSSTPRCVAFPSDITVVPK
jgi:hypothetical protein